MISHKYKFIFVHIPKSAGTSITDGLSDCELIHPFYHEKLSTLRKQCAPDYFAFTSIRNVYDRLISMVWSRYGKWDEELFYKLVTLHSDEVKDGASWSPAHVHKYLDGKINFKIRFDHLEEDWSALLDALQLEYRKLPHKKLNPYKKRNPKRNPYREYYDQKMLDMVKEVFAEEIQEYKWDF